MTLTHFSWCFAGVRRGECIKGTSTVWKLITKRANTEISLMREAENIERPGAADSLRECSRLIHSANSVSINPITLKKSGGLQRFTKSSTIRTPGRSDSNKQGHCSRRTRGHGLPSELTPQPSGLCALISTYVPNVCAQ